MIGKFLEFFFRSLQSRHSDRMSVPGLNILLQQFGNGAKKAMRIVWYPTLSWLRDTRDLRRTSQSTVYTREAEDNWNLAITNWKAAGEYLGLDENDTTIHNPNLFAEELDTASQPGWSPRSCAWRLCLCHGEAVHRMRVCKGCWRTHYCTTRCQTK